MFAILRLSKGLNGLGDLEILLLPERGDPDTGENCLPYQQRFRSCGSATYVAPRFCGLAAKVIVSVLFNKDTISEIIKRGMFGTMQHRAG